MPDRYAKNHALMTECEQLLLREKTAAVVGLGGLGGHIAEQLARLGFGGLILVDGDRIEASNLNRQLFATEKTLGMPKTEAAAMRLREVNSSLVYTLYDTKLTSENGRTILSGADVVFDAVDTIETRLLLQKICDDLLIVLIHGSIGGWWGQVSVIYPGDNTLSSLYSEERAAGAEREYGNPAFIPALVASIQVAEALKYCLKRPGGLRNKLLRIDLLEQTYFSVEV